MVFNERLGLWCLMREVRVMVFNERLWLWCLMRGKGYGV